MSKRKQDVDEGEDSDGSIVDIDFEFFDPNPEIDYLALKKLATQLFQGDAHALELQDFADLVLSQPRVGTSVKCDGKESDPYAFLSVVNLHVHQNRPYVKALLEYVLSKSSSDAQFHSTLRSLVGPSGLQSENHVAYVFSGRLVNMPVQIVPPMYRMLEEEIKWAADDGEPFRFTHYLFLAQTYNLTAEEVAELEENTAPHSKKHKGTSASSLGPGVYSVHPEDEHIQKFASHTVDFSYTTVQPRDKESFGLDTAGRMMLVPAENFPHLVQALVEAFPPPQ